MTTVHLSKLQAEEIRHKLDVLNDDDELQADYGLTQELATELLDSVPRKAGEWDVPEYGKGAVVGELRDHAGIVRDGAEYQLSAGKRLADYRLANALERIADEIEES